LDLAVVGRVLPQHRHEREGSRQERQLTVQALGAALLFLLQARAGLPLAALPYQLVLLVLLAVELGLLRLQVLHLDLSRVVEDVLELLVLRLVADGQRLLVLALGRRLYLHV